MLYLLLSASIWQWEALNDTPPLPTVEPTELTTPAPTPRERFTADLEKAAQKNQRKPVAIKFSEPAYLYPDTSPRGRMMNARQGEQSQIEIHNLPIINSQ